MQLQCIHYNVKQISSFIYAFEGEIYVKLRNIHVGKPPFISPFCLFVKTLTYLRSTFLKKKKLGKLLLPYPLVQVRTKEIKWKTIGCLLLAEWILIQIFWTLFWNFRIEIQCLLLHKFNFQRKIYSSVS